MLNTISKKFFTSNPERSVFYGLQSADLAKSLHFNRGLAYAYKNTGIGYFYKGENIDAIKSYQLSLATFDSMGDKKGVANIYSNMGNVYYNQGEDVEALDLYLKALKYADESKDTLRMLTALGNIGAIYGKKKQTYELAIKYYLQCLLLSKLNGDKSAIGITCANLGEVYMNKATYDSAHIYFDESLKNVDGTEDAP